MAKKRKSSNHGAAFVVGSLVGGLVGAVTALWKTPQSGDELRAKLASALPEVGGGNSGMNFSTVPAAQPSSERSVHNEAAQIHATTTAPIDDTTELPESGIGHAATTEELTHPPQPAT